VAVAVAVAVAVVVVVCMRHVLEKTQEYNWAVRPVFAEL